METHEYEDETCPYVADPQSRADRAVERLLSDVAAQAREGLDQLAGTPPAQRRSIVDEHLDEIVDAIAKGRSPAVQYRIASLVELAGTAPENVAETVLARASSTDDFQAFEHLALAAGRVCITHEIQLGTFSHLLVDNLTRPGREEIANLHLVELAEHHPQPVLDAWASQLDEHGWPSEA